MKISPRIFLVVIVVITVAAIAAAVLEFMGITSIGGASPLGTVMAVGGSVAILSFLIVIGQVPLSERAKFQADNWRKWTLVDKSFRLLPGERVLLPVTPVIVDFPLMARPWQKPTGGMIVTNMRILESVRTNWGSILPKERFGKANIWHRDMNLKDIPPSTRSWFGDFLGGNRRITDVSLVEKPEAGGNILKGVRMKMSWEGFQKPSSMLGPVAADLMSLMIVYHPEAERIEEIFSRPLETSTESSPIAPPISPQLTEYVRTSRGQGVADDATRKALIDSGWNAADVDRALR